jgi:hypothetical protein
LIEDSPAMVNYFGLALLQTRLLDIALYTEHDA